jgi:TM2 domain-containing membrane protein YozV
VTNSTRYWLSVGDGKTYGPYTVEELLQHRNDGRVGVTAQLCPEGGSNWMPATAVLEFRASASTPPVVPPPAPPFAPNIDPLAKSKVAAGILGILLGALGVHNFYLGYTGKGIAQLLITVLTCGWGSIFSGIWGLIEGILILTGSINVDGSGRPLRD